MDEISMCFGMSENQTEETIGKNTVLIKIADHERTRFTVVLKCLVDGRKLELMVIYKSRTFLNMPNVTKGIVLHVHRKE